MNGRELDAKIRSMPTEEIEAMLQNEYLQIVRDPKTGRFTKAEVSLSDDHYSVSGVDYRIGSVDEPDSGIAAAYAILVVVAIICGGIGFLIGHFA